MSFQDCFERTPQDCNADNECVLEYDTNDQFPSCVPRLNWTFGMSMSDEELSMFETLMVRLLPPLPHTELGKTRVIIALRELLQELKPRLDLKTRDLLKHSTRGSWQQVVQDVAKGVIEETRLLEEYMCSICYTRLGEGGEDGQQGLIGMTCCRHAYHRSCLKEWVSSGGRTCPMCSTRVSPEILEALQPRRVRVEHFVPPPRTPGEELLRQVIAEQRAQTQQRTEAMAARIRNAGMMRAEPDTNPDMIAFISFCVIVALLFAN